MLQIESRGAQNTEQKNQRDNIVSRKKTGPKYRPHLDLRFNNPIVGKFIATMMLDGKKSKCEKIFYAAIDRMEKDQEENGLDLFLKAIDLVKPMLEVKSRRIGGSTYQVPVEIRQVRRNSLAMRWIIDASRKRRGRSMEEKLYSELVDALNSTGGAFKKKEDVHRMAEANKAFVHYRW